ncbi:Leucine-rich repeat [Sesbania bispinosa]|nr:Leucine-rich repeat [Sesbania bispinosa]
MFNSSMCNLKVHCNEKDMSTLLHFKQGVTDPSSLLSSWFTEQDCCQWSGVQCDNITGRVVKLNLPCHINHSAIIAHGEKENKSHCLTGEFNLSLLELEFLSYLNLSNNDFKSIQMKCDDLSRGILPHQCGNSSNLHYIDLSYNYDIVIDNLHWISRLSSLQYLNLDGVALHKEIDWLQSMTMLPLLSELHLKNCQLENIYPSLSYANFTSLKVLDLSENDFISDLPIWLFNLSCDISHIDISQSHIYGQLPTVLPNLRSIKSLVLSQNYLKGPIPDWLGELEQLQELNLTSNSFSGPIPTSLGNLSCLIVCGLELNYLSGNLPEILVQLFNLEYLTVAGNSLTGNVSERYFLHLSNLKQLSLGSPALIFNFDPRWIPPFQLESIKLRYVSGKLPSWLFTQFSLKSLYIEDSSASFEPLDRFWNFTNQIDVLHLVNNSINGDMSNVSLNSKLIWLVSNNLRGSLPQLSTRVVIFCLYNNSLTGPIFPLLCHNMTGENSLVHLDLGYNHLSGELTECWNEWKMLIHIDLSYNNLTGKIPHSMGSLSNLLFLYLESNKLFGNIPLSLKNCQKLWIIDLSHNNLSGAIPRWMGQSLKALKLRSNQFSGNVPPQMCQLHSLMVMDFADNRLSGRIPNCLHNITAMLADHASTHECRVTIQVPGLLVSYKFSLMMVIKGSELEYWNLMKVIDLSSNNLIGIVPLEIFMLNGLQSLNLSHNHLVGTISEEIGKLKQLECFDVSTNRLSGKIPQSMSLLHYLDYLNLSFNNFMGKIPSGTQLQGFTNLSYVANYQLCGPPLTKICPQDEKPQNSKPMGEEDHDDGKSEFYSWFYMGLGIGFAVGFLGVLGAIFFNRTCRHAYFRFLYRLHDMVIQI